MSNPLCFTKAPLRSMVLSSLMSLALAASACGPEASEPSQNLDTQSQTLDSGCETESPILTVSGPTTITLQCNEPWVVPAASAVDACGNPLTVYRYNTGDDDQDGIPGTIDPDDYGPGPSTATNGEYQVQFLAWDEYYNITGEIIFVNVVNCPE
ncbi:hypothetical protein SAMN05444354_12571 [Stigmatella aurantiaca]|uniref:Lipoprotein n=2 Tax=Stigmatella aurantiaca TaxID=41 RepID=A0A1H8C3Z5_STIAU|nr:hypothetical protein SAMN05444354_12571 [Stigmatella aurantiaca]